MAILTPRPTPEAPASPASPSPTAVVPNAPQSLTIPLDHVPETKDATNKAKVVTTQDAATGADTKPTSKRPILRRDSMKRREALLKGKEGSRRRVRWENDNFVHNPYFTPPTAEDYSPQPLHKQTIVHYEYANLWDPSIPGKFGYKSTKVTVSTSQYPWSPTVDSKVPKNLKERIKKSKGAVGLLKELEEEVRRFAAGVWSIDDADDDDDALRQYEDEEAIEDGSEKDSEDEDIVFIPRNVTAREEKEKEKARLKERQKKEIQAKERPLFESPSTDPSASFVRWIIHTIAPYYGLTSWSVTTSDTPSKRIAYVGVKPSGKKKKADDHVAIRRLPRPLWGML